MAAAVMKAVMATSMKAAMMEAAATVMAAVAVAEVEVRMAAEDRRTHRSCPLSDGRFVP